MSKSISTEASLFASQIENRRFNTGTLQILESILVAKDVSSLLEIRSALRELLRSQSMAVLVETSVETADVKLRIVEFFVRAFALIGDVESCLALKYEALVLREAIHLKDRDLQVSYEEWLTFGRDSLNNGFYTIAVRGFENALVCIKSHTNVDPGPVAAPVVDTINDIKRLRDIATALVASHSDEHRRRRIIEKRGKTGRQIMARKKEK
ncbi:uncharacterized protein LOC109718689 isoform X1 [Ananas comosus]|uniref:Uncharacterized protein LOC109718689 isoform X1 n=1 Tax=Ananas comosus TaxID=4615 RepID=A0A6P5FYB4_ANACO|nr:uncharacterized protein LOC109718689 isoform X1 [Ananas comosus]